MTNRSTAEVLEDHLDSRQRNALGGDLIRNYAPDVVLLTSRGAFHGHQGVRHLHRMLREAIGSASYEFPVKLIDGPFAFIEWRARLPGKSVEDGADSFVVRDGRIVLQTIHYSIQVVMPA